MPDRSKRLPDLRQMEAVVALAEERHFGRASARIGVTQSALSNLLSRLEDASGVRLFDRTARHVRPTATGAAFIASCRVALAAARRAAAELDTAASEGRWSGTLRVGTVPCAEATFLPEILQNFAAESPGCAVDLRRMYPDEQERALREGELDVGFLHPPAEDPDLVRRDVWQGRWQLAVPSSHPLAESASITLAECTHNDALIRWPRRTAPGLYQQTDAVLERATWRPTTAHHVERPESALAWVADGMGVCLLPEWIGEAPPDVRLVSIRGLETGPRVSVVYRRADVAGGLARFLAALRTPRPVSERRRAHC